VITDSFHDFFLASAGASAALIGLLFVAVSVAPDRVVGPKAAALHQVRATMALTALVSTLVLSLIALLPDTNIGWPATIIGAAGALFVAGSLRRFASADTNEPRRRAVFLLAGFLLVMLYETSSGIRLVVHPHATGAVTGAAAGAIALLAIGIDRAWELVGGRRTGIGSSLTDLAVGQAEPHDSTPTP